MSSYVSSSGGGRYVTPASQHSLRTFISTRFEVNADIDGLLEDERNSMVLFASSPLPSAQDILELLCWLLCA
jgi:hypothetical protein